MKKLVLLALVTFLVSHNAVASEQNPLGPLKGLMQAGTLVQVAGTFAGSAAVVGIGAYKAGEFVAKNCSHSTTTICALLGLGITAHRAAQFVNKQNSFSEQFSEKPFIPNAFLLVAGGAVARGAIGTCLNLSKESPFWSTVAIGSGVICGVECIANSLK